MDKERQDQLVKHLQAVQHELEKMGLKSLIAPCALPQGLTLSLMVGETEQAIAASYTAQHIGAGFAHTADLKDSTLFADELASNIAERAIWSAAARREGQ